MGNNQCEEGLFRLRPLLYKTETVNKKSGVEYCGIFTFYHDTCINQPHCNV